MNVFVTVGTTNFDSLLEAADNCAAKLKDYQFTFQIASSTYKPQHGGYFEYIEDIEDYYNCSDIIITHAGAGSTYKLLELHKKIIVVPNLERVDKHQSDLAKFIEENQYALVVWDIDNLLSILQSANDFMPKLYEKEHFFKAEEIASFILSL